MSCLNSNLWRVWQHLLQRWSIIVLLLKSFGENTGGLSFSELLTFSLFA